MTSSNEALKRRVEAVLDMAVTTVSSLNEAFSSGIPVASDGTGLTYERDSGSTKATVEQKEQERGTGVVEESVSNNESNSSQA